MTYHKARSSDDVRALLEVAHLQFAKCELKDARATFVRALELSKENGDLHGRVEVLVGLLRCAGEALDEESIGLWNAELDRAVAECAQAHTGAVPPMVWYIRGAIATFREDWKEGERFFLKHVKAVKRQARVFGLDADSALRSTSGEYDSHPEHMLARGLAMMANTQWQQGRTERARFIAHTVLERFGNRKYRGVNGAVFQILGAIAEREKDFKTALQWFQKAHSSYMEEHNWYHYLYVLYRYARLARIQQNYPQAYWNIDLVDKAANGPEFGVLRRVVQRERAYLEQDAVDILIDTRKGLVKTRDGGSISLRKQYVLMDILKALSYAHNEGGDEAERGLSKAEIIERVWQESYRPEAHDNKLYYNINRLRKLIEPDSKQPRYLLSWKEGYRLAPGLRVQYIGGGSAGAALTQERAPAVRGRDANPDPGETRHTSGLVLKKGNRKQERRRTAPYQGTVS